MVDAVELTTTPIGYYTSSSDDDNMGLHDGCDTIKDNNVHQWQIKKEWEFEKNSCFLL